MTQRPCPPRGAVPDSTPLRERRGPGSLAPLGALAAGFGFVSLSLAQTATPAAEPALPQVTVKGASEQQGKDTVRATTTSIGKGQQELRDVPQSVTVVTERLLDDRNLDTLKDALKTTAGITFQAAEGGEEDIRLRGFSLQSTGDIFIDGVRDPAFYDRDSFNWDRLELLRGSASMLFGRGSTGGAANQVSKQPMLMDQNEIAVTMGNAGFLRSVGDFNVKTGDNAAFRLTGMLNTGDNHGAPIDKYGLAPTYRWGIGTADEFTIGLYHLYNKNGVHYGHPWLNNTIIPGLDGRVYYGMASDYNKSGATFATLGHVHRFRDGAQWQTTLRVGEYFRDLRASAIRFAPAAAQPGGVAVTAATFGPGTVLRRSGGNGVQLKNQDMAVAYLQSDYTGKFQALGIEHAVTTGADLAIESKRVNGLRQGSPVLTKPDITAGNPEDGAWVDESLRVLTQTSDFDAKGLGVYFQDLAQVAEHWKLLAGLRWDRFGGDYNTYSAQNATLGAVTASRSRTDSVWSRRFGVLYQPTPTQSYHLSYGTSFNTSGDTYSLDVRGANTPPERSRNVELGAKLDWLDNRFTTRLALFHATKFNERNTDPLIADAYLLSGKRHAAGFEMDLAGRITPAWEVFGSYTWIPSANIDNAPAGSLEAKDTRPGLTPRHSGSIWSTYRVTQKWRVGGGLNARSSDKPVGTAAPIVAPKFMTADLMAEYVEGPLAFKLNLFNVSDEIYADQLYRGHYIPGKPRTLQLTTAYKF